MPQHPTRRAIARRQRQPHMGADLDHLIEPDRARARLSCRLGDRHCLVGALRHDHQSKPAALQPANGDPTGQRGAQPLGNFDEELVVPAAAEGILQLLEVAKLDERKPHRRATTAGGQCIIEHPKEQTLVRQSGQRVLMRQPARGLIAAHQQPSQPIELPERQAGEAQEGGCDQRSQRKQPKHQRHRGPLRFPAEPADDAAFLVEQRLHLAPVPGRIVVEAEVLEARRALKRADQRRVKPRDIRREHLQRLDGAAQRFAVRAFEFVIRLPGQHQPDHGANDGRDQHQKRNRRQKARPPAALGRRLGSPAEPGTQPVKPPPASADVGLVTTLHRILRPTRNSTLVGLGRDGEFRVNRTTFRSTKKLENPDYFSPNQSVAIPRNDRNPTTSVTVVTNGPDDTAGSTPSRVRMSGIRIPPSAAAASTVTIASPMTRPRSVMSNQVAAITPMISAKERPWSAPTSTSRRMMRQVFALESSRVASARTVTVMVWVPALPPMLATIGISTASATILAIEPSKLLITQDESSAVSRLANSQGNRPRAMVQTESESSSSPRTPPSALMSSSASSSITSTMSSKVRTPTSRLSLSTTGAETRS